MASRRKPRTGDSLRSSMIEIAALRFGHHFWDALVSLGIATEQWCNECQEFGEHASNCLSGANADDYEPSEAQLEAYYDTEAVGAEERYREAAKRKQEMNR